MIRVNITKSKRCNGDFSLFVTFDFDMRIVNIIREFPSKYWNADKKEWELPLNRLSDLVSRIDWTEFDITGTYVSTEKKKAEMPTDFKFKTQPYEHQIEGFNFGLQYDRWLLADEMGLGKTKQVIDIAVAKKLQKNYKHCLIICGVNGLKWNWQNEISVHSDEQGYILGQRIQRGKVTIGSNADKLTDVMKIATNPAYFIITNIETLRNEDIVTELQKLIDAGEIGALAFDECHKAKNAQSQQGKGILKLHAETMIAMTGTPIMNNPLDLYVILKWLGYEKHSFYAFKNHYCVMGGYGGYEIVGYKNLEELQAQVKDIMLRRRKDDVLDLPEKTYIDEFVDMTPKQAQIYKETTAEIKANIDQIKMASNPLAELIRMRQATGYTGILSSMIQESAKLDRMEELVEEAVENNKQVVIFSNWTQITDVVIDRLKSYRCGVITGATPDADRQTIVDKFQNHKYQVMIGTTGAMGTGITLTAGTVEIFLDEPWNKANKVQAEDRCHRIGQNSNLTIYTIMCKDTIDQRIHELVEKKGAISDVMIDGSITKENAREVLDFLLS